VICSIEKLARKWVFGCQYGRYPLLVCQCDKLYCEEHVWELIDCAG